MHEMPEILHMRSDEKQQFLDWLEEIKWLFPPKMTLHECKLLWERKVKEERELKDNQ